MNERAEKIKYFFKNNVGYLISTAEALAFVLLSLVRIDETGKTLQEIIGSGFVFYILQLTLVTLLRHQGLINGENDERVLNTYELHGDKVDEIADDMDALEQWCEEENANNYKRVRRRILASAGLKYDDYFKKDGSIEPYNIDLTKMSLKWSNRFIREAEIKKINAYNKAVHLKLSKIDATSLTSGNQAKEDKFAFGKGKKEFLRVHGMADALIRSLPALFFGIYGFHRIENWTWANFAWIVFQAVLAYSSAIPQMFSAKSYVIDDLRGDVVKKIRLIDKFICDFNRYPEHYKRTKQELQERKALAHIEIKEIDHKEEIMSEGIQNERNEESEVHGRMVERVGE